MPSHLTGSPLACFFIRQFEGWRILLEVVNFLSIQEKVKNADKEMVSSQLRKHSCGS